MTQPPPPPPSALCFDTQTKAKVIAVFLQDTREIATMPANKFWNNITTDLTGLWTEAQFNARFQVM
jgi:hypothetical protein